MANAANGGAKLVVTFLVWPPSSLGSIPTTAREGSTTSTWWGTTPRPDVFRLHVNEKPAPPVID